MWNRINEIYSTPSDDMYSMRKDVSVDYESACSDGSTHTQHHTPTSTVTKGSCDLAGDGGASLVSSATFGDDDPHDPVSPVSPPLPHFTIFDVYAQSSVVVTKMAEEEANYGVSVPGGTSMPGGDLSIRVLDQAAKGKASVAKESASSSAGDNAAAMLDRLNLTTQEPTAFVLEEDDEDYPGCLSWALVGKVLAPNTLHVSTIKAALRPAWGNPRGLEFHLLGANRFLAEFGSKADKDRVSDGSPWTISKHCIMLKEFDPSLKPSDVCFDTLSMWVRILNLPFGLMNDDRGKALASTLGKVERMDVDDKGRAWGDYMRVRIFVDVNQPLMRCVSVFSHKRRVTDVYEECNFTGDIFLLLRSMGAGVVMREHSGSCIVCCGIGVPDVILPELPEAIAIQRGLQFALCEGIQEVLLGSDCLTIVQRINSLGQD
ncbi:hypothetical protein D1007_55169 [Hordeum vulgare]|nr:hypothetical protein D1007_55169 [Hordeum vulgare]